jgi:hypothetical protein
MQFRVRARARANTCLLPNRLKRKCKPNCKPNCKHNCKKLNKTEILNTDIELFLEITARIQDTIETQSLIAKTSLVVVTSCHCQKYNDFVNVAN